MVDEVRGPLRGAHRRVDRPLGDTRLGRGAAARASGVAATGQGSRSAPWVAIGNRSRCHGAAVGGAYGPRGRARHSMAPTRSPAAQLLRHVSTGRVIRRWSVVCAVARTRRRFRLRPRGPVGRVPRPRDGHPSSRRLVDRRPHFGSHRLPAGGGNAERIGDTVRALLLGPPRWCSVCGVRRGSFDDAQGRGDVHAAQPPVGQ